MPPAYLPNTNQFTSFHIRYQQGDGLSGDHIQGLGDGQKLIVINKLFLMLCILFSLFELICWVKVTPPVNSVAGDTLL